jgi:hypothetical protein
MRKAGFDVFEGVIDKYTRKLLLSEALRLSAKAVESHVPFSDTEEVRGGNPARSFLTGPGGELQDRLYKAPWMLSFLRDITYPSLIPTGDLGTYSYYARAGDYLAIHRDIVTCDVAVITCLHNSPEFSVGGMLSQYPDRLFEPLSAIRATPEKGADKLQLEIGQTIVMFGGVVPHALLPVADEQVRIVSVMCYRIP